MKQNEVIFNLRKEKNLTLEELSELTGISRNMLWHLEKGDRTGTIETLKKLSNFYNVSLDYITVNNKRENIIDDFIKDLVLQGKISSSDEIPEEIKNDILRLIKEKVSNVKK